MDKCFLLCQDYQKRLQDTSELVRNAQNSQCETMVHQEKQRFIESSLTQCFTTLCRRPCAPQPCAHQPCAGGGPARAQGGKRYGRIGGWPCHLSSSGATGACFILRKARTSMVSLIKGIWGADINSSISFVRRPRHPGHPPKFPPSTFQIIDALSIYYWHFR